MKNVFLSFIKTEVAGSLDKSLALLDIITTLLKFTANDMQAVSSYRSKKNQWWGLI